MTQVEAASRNQRLEMSARSTRRSNLNYLHEPDKLRTFGG